MASRRVAFDPVAGGDTPGAGHVPSRPIIWWAGIGAAFLALMVYTLAAWIGSAEFRPTRPGPDPIPGWTLILIDFVEVTTPLYAVISAWRAWTSSRSEGRLSTPALLGLTWLTVWWLDASISYVRPAYAFNAYFVNFGNPTGNIPFWINPVSSRMAEPILMGPLGYFAVNAAISLAIVGFMAKVKSHRPQLGTMTMVLVGFAGGIAIDLLFEAVMILANLGFYTSVVPALSVYWGKTSQLPVYQVIMWGMMSAAPAILVHFQDRHGLTLVERGLERPAGWMRVLAMSGYLHVCFALYIAVFSLFQLYAAPVPAALPSWLVNEECGAGTHYACPAQLQILSPADRLPAAIPGRDYARRP